jgi:RNA-directed DNA polymerase
MRKTNGQIVEKAREGTGQRLAFGQAFWLPLSMDGIVLFNPASVPVIRYRYRGAIPTPWAKANHA